jgi:Gpi18-like mannosyltransferase
MKKHLLILLVLTIGLNLFFWSIFKFNLPQFFGYSPTSIFTVFANYDGPNYLVISKCGYNANCIRSNFSLPQFLEYYPAHLPGYPALIHLANLLASGPWAMLLVTLVGNILLTIYFYKFLLLYQNPKRAFCLSLLFLIFPGRFFVAKMVGAPESWFVASILASIFYYKKDKTLVSALFLGLAQSLKTPAIILLFAFVLHALINKKLSRIAPHVLASILVISIIFGIYKSQTGDFFAYFHSGDNRHLSFMPFQVFLANQTWIQSIWLEEILYIFLLSFVAIYRLQKKYKTDISVIFTWLFVLALVFVGHRDLSRYAAPVYPFIYLTFAPILVNKQTKLLFLLLLPAVLLYAVNFVLGNAAPVANWAPYL